MKLISPNSYMMYFKKGRVRLCVAEAITLLYMCPITTPRLIVNGRVEDCPPKKSGNTQHVEVGVKQKMMFCITTFFFFFFFFLFLSVMIENQSVEWGAFLFSFLFLFFPNLHETPNHKGLDDEPFPWGSAVRNDKCNGWTGEFPTKNNALDGYVGTAPVDAYEPNGFGIYK
jgi:hypothetical protein